MPSLLITSASPNPAGRDRTPANRVTADQLNAEWVEFRNATRQTVSLAGVQVLHRTFDERCQRTGEASHFTFSGSLEAGWSVRLHGGPGVQRHAGTTWHVHLQRTNFVWNNRCGDTAIIRASGGDLVDYATYAPGAPDGAVLGRVAGTNRLEPVALASLAERGRR